jgi:divalent metal cation (Fe/Co/Zn/Cd) transporter
MSKEADLRQARRLAFVTIFYLCSTAAMLFLIAAGSQALKTEFVGDAISILPPILFLVGNRISRRPPDALYPYGYERAVAAGYLGSALALLAVGLFLFSDAAMKLARLEHPALGGIHLLGRTVWIGWIAIPVLLYCSIPAFFLGRAKRRLGGALHDKVLVADAQINAANWQSAGAAMLGILGIAFGFWWADAAAALFISVEIVRDGILELRAAIGDVMDRRPQDALGKEPDPLPAELCDYLMKQDWVEDAIVRVREHGRRFSAQAYVVPKEGADILTGIAEASAQAPDIDERLRELSITPLRRFTRELEAIRPDRT